MQTDNYPRQELNGLSYGTVLKELGNSTKDLIHSEITFITTELKNSMHKFGRHSAQAAAFGAILALSVFPFVAFLVIGLGVLLDGRYWLSSLIVAVVFALIGGPFAYRAFKKIKEEDLDFSRIKSTIEKGAETVQHKVDEVKAAAKGERHEFNTIH